MDRERTMDFDTGEMDFLSSRSQTVSSPPSASSAAAAGPNGGGNYIIHTVSKFDTLAGVAIKYGVEVADIKKLNGLVTDLQMFALKTLQIPLPGRHPPSTSLCNSHETPPRTSSPDPAVSKRRHSDFFDSFQSLKLKPSSDKKVSPAMSTLQGYYGLRGEPDKKSTVEMSVYQNGRAHNLEDGLFSSLSNPPLSHHRKSRSVANGLMSANGNLSDPLLSDNENITSDKWIEKLLRRRQKSEADFTARRPQEKLLKEENGNSSAFSAITGKGLALRPKSATRTASTGLCDSETGGLNPIPIGMGDAFLTDSADGAVRKSSSASSLQDSDNNGALSSLWSLKPDFQALSSAAIPIFDGLPKPIGRRNKTAVD